MLNIELEPGESIRIGNYATVTLVKKSGKRARLSFQADKGIPINKIDTASSDAKLAARYGLESIDK